MGGRKEERVRNEGRAREWGATEREGRNGSSSRRRRVIKNKKNGA